MKILVIDDDPGTTDLLKLILRPTSSLVFAAHSGSEGISLTREILPDIIILDLMMPDIHGCEVCRVIREFSNVPILALSALDTPNSVAASLDAGADDYLVKPVASNVLIAYINKLIRRTGPLNRLPNKDIILPLEM